MSVGGHLGVSGIRPERADQPSPGQRPGVADAKRKSSALCNPPPTLLGQDGGEDCRARYGECGHSTQGVAPPGGVALPWAGLICPFGAYRASPIYSWNHSAHRIIRPYHPVPRGFAPVSSTGPGLRPGLSSGGPTGRIRPPNTLLFGGLVVCAPMHPLTQVAASHMG